MLKRMSGTGLFWVGVAFILLGIGSVVLGYNSGSIVLVIGLVLLILSARAPVWRLFAFPPHSKDASVHDVRAATFEEARKKLAQTLPAGYEIKEYEN
jgi:hypothetical protein